MGTEYNHNHFCIYCGAKLDAGQNFCSECGKPVFKNKVDIKADHSRYGEKITQLESEYDLKQGRATELVEKLFGSSHVSYERFTDSIVRSNNLFSTQVEIARKMDELDFDEKPFVKKEIENKLATLQTFIDKMDDLINELIIQISSNKDDSTDINNLFKDMDDLIDSVKDY